jgi:hypothetical protein
MARVVSLTDTRRIWLANSQCKTFDFNQFAMHELLVTQFAMLNGDVFPFVVMMLLVDDREDEL